MAKNANIKICNTFISFSFYALFFFTPLLVMPINSELFELNKMVFVYFLTILIASSFLIKSITEGKFKIRRTPLDIPIIIFLVSQIVSTILSIDLYISLWGYYGRFNGGLIPTITYVILYYIFVTHFSFNKSRSVKNKQSENFQLKRLLYFSLASGFLVSVYGIAQHFGIDKHIWVQDVQNRIFSTLGQPNWLAAYIVVLLFITIGLFLISNLKFQISKEKAADCKLKRFALVSNIRIFGFRISDLMLYVICYMFYVVLLFTKSRSGFLAFWGVNLFFWLVTFLKLRDFRKILLKPFLVLNFSFLILTFIFSSPFAQINNYLSLESFQAVKTENQSTSSAEIKNDQPESNPALGTQITESGDIRKAVWQGAINAFLARPVFGWGVETFAWAFYMHKPLEHNLTSEWDFLYNKAHNEYLNYLATTGAFGLGSHLILIGVFLFWIIVNVKTQISNFNSIPKSKNQKILKLEFKNLDLIWHYDFEIWILTIGLFSAWLSILITNFFGFSVVIISLYFWLIPAMIFAMREEKRNSYFSIPFFQKFSEKPKLKIATTIVTLLFAIYCLLFTVLFWTSDYFYSRATKLEENDEYQKAYKYIQTAVSLKPAEPIFHDEAAIISAYLSLVAFSNEDSTKSAELAVQAISQSDTAIQTSPYNLNFWKTRTRMFYTLSQIETFYIKDAIHSLLAASTIAPNDPKILYNLALLYRFDDQKEEANQSLEKALETKPNYKDAAYGLAVFAQEDKNEDAAQRWYHYILEKIDPNDEEIQKRVNEKQ